ncbi:MAG: alpha/beta hydrolase [Pseudomonadota bacterium]|nr:alpha/beta hydrolase [Pseudomonadota bacterium]
MPNASSPDANMPPKADAQMQAVLDQVTQLGGKPIETLTPAEARQQPTSADAVMALLKAQGKPTAPEAVGTVTNSTFPGPGGAVPIRIYMPASAAPANAGKGPLPVVLYIHGGGWVIANLDPYDASPCAIANAANAIVVSTHYRKGPAHMFPAAHDDTLAAYQWVLKNAGKLSGDPKRIAVVGESAGGNMAANIALAARRSAHRPGQAGQPRQSGPGDDHPRADRSATFGRREVRRETTRRRRSGDCADL